MPPRSDPPLHPLDQAVARFRAASILDKPAAAEAAVTLLVDSVKRLEAALEDLLEQAPPRVWQAPGAPS